MKRSDRDDATLGCAELIAQCRLFMPSALRGDLGNALALHVRHCHTLRRGELLAAQGDRFKALYLLAQGACASVQADATGREQIIAVYGPRELIGLDALAEHRHATTLRILATARVFVFPWSAVETLSQQRADLFDQLVNYIAQRLQEAEQLQFMLGSMDSAERVVFFIEHASKVFDKQDGGFELPMSRADIGSFLGISLETTSRWMAQLQRDGVIEVRGRRIVVPHANRLRTWPSTRDLPHAKHARPVPAKPVTHRRSGR